jgi:hypothetical protein
VHALDRSPCPGRPRWHGRRELTSGPKQRGRWREHGGAKEGGVALGKGTEDGAHRNGFTMSRWWLGPERRCLTVAEALQRL